MHPLEQLLPFVTYKPGWSFEFQTERGTPFGYLTVLVRTTDSVTEQSGQCIFHRSMVPPVHQEGPEALDWWLDWLMRRVGEIETHEACEFFKLAGAAPFFPHDPDGGATYRIRRVTDVPAKEALMAADRGPVLHREAGPGRARPVDGHQLDAH